MDLLMVLVCLFFNFINRATLGKTLNIARLQNWIWGFVFGIYALNLLDYYDIIDEVYLWAFVYIVVFNIVYLGATYVTSVKRGIKYHVELSETNYDTYIKRITKLSMVCWLLSVPQLRVSIPILLSSGMSVLRYKIYAPASIYSSHQMVLIMYLLRPIFVISIIVFTIMIANRKFNFKYLWIVLLNIADYTLLTSGRALMVEFFIMLVFTVLVFDGASIIKLLKKYKRYVIPFVLLLIIALYISSLRVTSSFSLIEEGIIYFSAGFVFLSQLVKSGLVTPFAYFGRLIFSFIIDDFLLGLNTLRLGNFQLANNSVSAIAATSLRTAPNIGTNATATLLLDFVLDAGLIGVIVGAIWLAILASQVEKSFYKTKTIMSCALMLLIMEKIFAGVQSYYFEHGYATFEIIYILLILRPVFKGGLIKMKSSFNQRKGTL